MTTTEPQPSFEPPVGTEEPRRFNGVGLAALIVGAVALLLAFLPFGSFAAFLPALAAIVLGIVGLALRNRRRGMAVAGLILGGVALVVAIVLSVIAAIGIVGQTAAGIERLRSDLPTDFPTDFPSDESVTANPPIEPSESASPGLSLAPGHHTVVYTVSGSGTATVNYATFAGGDTEASAGKQHELPFRRTVTADTTEGNRFASFTVGATQIEPKEPVTCTITVDGAVVSRQTTDRTSFAYVLCTARSSF
jgi:hypothetical protein